MQNEKIYLRRPKPLAIRVSPPWQWNCDTFNSAVILVYLSTNQFNLRYAVSTLLSFYLSIYRVACDACSRASCGVACLPLLRREQSKQAAAAAAAKRLFWHLTARQIFTASSSVRLSHRKYPTHSLAPSPLPLSLARLRFFLLYSQIGNLYFFRNDLSPLLPPPPRNRFTE